MLRLNPESGSEAESPTLTPDSLSPASNRINGERPTNTAARRTRILRRGFAARFGFMLARHGLMLSSPPHMGAWRSRTFTQLQRWTIRRARTDRKLETFAH